MAVGALPRRFFVMPTISRHLHKSILLSMYYQLEASAPPPMLPKVRRRPRRGEGHSAALAPAVPRQAGPTPRCAAHTVRQNCL